MPATHEIDDLTARSLSITCRVGDKSQLDLEKQEAISIRDWTSVCTYPLTVGKKENKNCRWCCFLFSFHFWRPAGLLCWCHEERVFCLDRGALHGHSVSSNMNKKKQTIYPSAYRQVHLSNSLQNTISWCFMALSEQLVVGCHAAAAAEMDNSGFLPFNSVSSLRKLPGSLGWLDWS